MYKYYLKQELSFDYVQFYKDRIGTDINAGINKGGDNRFGKFKIFIKYVHPDIVKTLIKDQINVQFQDGRLILEIKHENEENEKITSKAEDCNVPYWYMADTYNKGHTWQQLDEVQFGVSRDLHDTNLGYILPAGNLTYEIQTKHKNPGSQIWQV